MRQLFKDKLEALKGISPLPVVKLMPKQLLLYVRH